MWQNIRVVILLLTFATVAQQNWLEQADLSWKNSFYVALYPINVDDSEAVSRYIATLKQDDFEPIAEYFAQEAEGFGLNLRRPIELRLGEEIKELPPAPPRAGSALEAIIWSLRFRLFAWQNSPRISINPKIRMYLLFHDPKTYKRLSHSSALNKGRLGYVNLFGSKNSHPSNLVVLAHEMLHTLGATDKYDLNTTLPMFPDGFAEPDKQPLYPQQFAELMGGRVPISETRADIPIGLSQVIMREKTAREIQWLQ